MQDFENYRAKLEITIQNKVTEAINKLIDAITTKLESNKDEIIQSLKNDVSSFQSPADISLLKVNNRNTRTRCEICSKITIKIPERRQWRHSGIFIVNFEHVVVVTPCSSIYIVNFEHVMAAWVKMLLNYLFFIYSPNHLIFQW